MKKWKLMLCAVLAGLLLMAGAAHAKEDNITVIIEGEKVEFGKSPIIENGTTLVPFRALFESLGLEVEWVQETKTVYGSGSGVFIQLQVGQKTAFINGKDVELRVAPRIIDGSTYVPLRVIGEATGREVAWDSATRTITIGPSPFEALYQAFIDARNAEDLDAFLTLFHPESPLLEGGALKAEARSLFENYDVVIETEEFDIVSIDDFSVLMFATVKVVNTNDHFFLDNRSEMAFTLLKDDNGDWKIHGVESYIMEFLFTDEELAAERDIDAGLKKSIEDVIVAYVEASENEDLEALLDTIDPESPIYWILLDLMEFQFLDYDLDYDLEQINVLGVTGADSYVYTVITQKVIDDSFSDATRAKEIYHLKKQADGSWKIYTSYLLDYEFLDEE